MVNDNVIEYMDKVKEYYESNKQETRLLTIQEVMNRMLKENQYDNHKSNFGNYETGNFMSRSEVNLEELYKNKIYNNECWNISAEKYIFSHRKFIGRFIVLGKKFVRKFLRWYINPIIEDQNEFNGSVTRCINEIYNKLIANEELNNKYMQLNDVTEELKNKYEQLSNISRVLNVKHSELFSATDAIQNKLNKQDSVQSKLNELEKNIVEYKNEVTHVTNAQEDNFAYFNFKLKKLQTSNTNKMIGLTDSNQVKCDINVDNKNDNLDYFLFENKFRGEQSVVKDSQTQYLKYFDGCQNVLDIGCGRGEFLELLYESGISAKGIDIYDDFVDYCNSKGFEVEKSDAIEYLSKVPDNSLGGIFLGQVIEHLDKNYLLNLIEISFRKLKVGGYLIAETPNPTMLTTFTNAFYTDLSHVKPIHPNTIMFLLKFYGFKNIEIIYNESSKINYSLPLLEGDEHIHNISQFNDGINLLNKLLFGYQDYAVLGRK